jgi:hypothetical protein
MTTIKESMPKSSKKAKIIRGALQTGSSIPVAGGALSAAASAWSENDQENVNNFFERWIKMIEEEIMEQQKTIIEVAQRIDLQDEKIAKRTNSAEYQSILKKTFREWSAAESEEKRVYIRNILANAASSEISSDDVIKLFISWLSIYSEFHFQVIASIYKNQANGISRRDIWNELRKNTVSEESADADLYKLLIRDLSTGGIIRQKDSSRRPSGSGKVSAFDDYKKYVLTELGKQFVHYAMTDLPLKIESKSSAE